MPDLRGLLEKATPGPWVWTSAQLAGDEWWQVGPSGNNAVTANCDSEADAALIVLAPQLAELVLEAEEAMGEIADSPPAGHTRVEHAGDIGMRERPPKEVARAWLARYHELTNEGGS